MPLELQAVLAIVLVIGLVVFGGHACGKLDAIERNTRPQRKHHR